MAENRQANIDTALVLGTLGRANVADDARVGLSSEQLANLARFESKLPANASETKIFDLPGGGKAFQADSASRNVPGSYAQYEKQVNASGETIQFTKTTFGPGGEIVHVKDKIGNHTITQ